MAIFPHWEHQEQLIDISIYSILYLTDPETFASLVLVDHAWREASQTPHLYAHHLSRCPSFSRSHNYVGGPFTEESLPFLKRQFAREVKRNLFEAYLQPKRTFVNLVSTTASSSAAFPGGEAFDFSFSPNGHWLLALSSSRIYVIDTVSPKISVQRELKVLRRPVSAAILDDGSMLAVLSDDHRVNVYNMTNLEVKHLRSVSLDNPPHTIALSPKGEVVAAAFDGGIEVHSLASNAMESDHRDIKCDRVDALTFSSDGTMLFGTTKNSKNPNTVILSAPYFTDDHQDLPPSEQIGHLWTSQILFPNSSRDCSNAILLPNRSDGDANWSFAYDKVFESFRAVRTDDLRNGTTYFTGPKHPSRDGSRSARKKLTPCTLPTASDRGELVAAGFLGQDVWLYGVPEGLDTSTMSQTDDMSSQPGPSAGASTPSSEARSPTTPSNTTRTPAISTGLPRTPARSFTRGEATELTSLPKWQVLVDKHRNLFVKGRRIAEISGVSGVCWVRKEDPHGCHSLAERLIIAAPGGIPGDPELEQDGFAAVDGGRLIIMDFDRTANDGETEEVTFEVGINEPELLEEACIDIDTEVALARRRTIKREHNESAIVANLLASAPPVPALPIIASTANAAIANASSSATRSRASRTTEEGDTQQASATGTSPGEGEGLSLEEASEIFGGSYDHTQPRSRNSLYRSATAVAASRQRNPRGPRIVEQARPRFRRAGDRTELPHESDADNWVPPPPAYTKEPDRPLPEELRRTLIPSSTEPVRRVRIGRDWPRRASTTLNNTVPEGDARRISSLPERPPMPSQRTPTGIVPPSQHALSGSMSQRSRPVSPMSTIGPSFGDEPSEPSVASPRPSTASSSRRPMSVFVGNIASSFRRPSTSRLESISQGPQPRVLTRRQPGASISLPPSPNRERPGSPITLTGANLQQRLEYPLPPAPTNSSMESLSRRFNPSNQTPMTAPRAEPSAYEEMNSIAASMPSAQQLANLNNRSRQAPPPPSARQSSAFIPSPSGYPIPAPPRGALGAAGNPTASSPLHSPSRSLSDRNSFARSSPALLRPAPRRLDTIASVSSSVSRTRSKSRDLNSAGSDRPRVHRSQSWAPALMLDRSPNDVQQPRRGLFRKGKKEKGQRRRDTVDAGFDGDGDGVGKGGKCLVM